MGLPETNQGDAWEASTAGFESLFLRPTQKRRIMGKNRPFVVKMQLSIGGEPGTLVYSRDRSFEQIFPREMGEEVFRKFKLKYTTLGGVKAFFLVKINKKNELEVVTRVKDRAW